MRETKINRKMTKNANTNTDETAMKNEKAAAKSDMKTKKRDRQIVTMTVTEAATVMTAETNTETKKTIDFKFKKNIRLLATTQMMLKVLFIFQTSLLCFHVNQSSVRQDMFLSHDNICYYVC